MSGLHHEYFSSGISLLNFLKIKKISNLSNIVSSQEKMSNIKKMSFY